MASNGHKFVSVNLNKSYGQPRQSSHYNAGGHSYGQAAAAGRGWSVGGASAGMGALSRSRGMVPKVVPKLSVPPPLNLPSLRKEHEKYDVLGAGGSAVGSGSGVGSRPASSGVGWTKPASVAVGMTEKNGRSTDTPGSGPVDTMDPASATSGSYMPPFARSVGVIASTSRDIPVSSERVMVLGGEDFPTLQAARPVSSGAVQKQKDGLIQKQKQVENKDSNIGSKERDLQSGVQFLENSRGSGSSQILKNGKYHPDPLPLVHMSTRSDWADDERDTGRGFVGQEREAGVPRSENYWNRDFDFPRPTFLPYKPISERHSQKDNEIRHISFNEVRRNNDIREAKEVEKWRTAPLTRIGVGSQEAGNYRVDVQGKMAGAGNISKENKYVPPHFGDTRQDASSISSQPSVFGRKDFSTVGRQHQKKMVESFSRGSDSIRRDQHVSEQNSRLRGDIFQETAFSKPSLGSSGNMGPMANPIMIRRDKRFSKSDNPFSEEKPLLFDVSSTVFDEKDLHSGVVAGIIKRKKDAAKTAYIHDPVRESFEAELERVQMAQERERKRIIEEQERAIEQAQRDEEEREKRIREEEERLRKLEDEAREAAWRAEQEHLEAIHRAEEQRTAREEEKKIIQQEEDRRKQAAKQMLQELEARMAKKQADTVKDASFSENMQAPVKEKYTSRKIDLAISENGNKAVENVKLSSSFDSSKNIRPEIESKAYQPREDSPNFLERGKPVSSWRRDAAEISNLDTGHYRPKYDMHGASRTSTRRELYGGTQHMPYRESKVEEIESPPDDFLYMDNRWSFYRNLDSHGKIKVVDSELHDDIGGKYGDNGWGHKYSRANSRPPYSDRIFSPAEANDAYVSGRSRYSMKQPRVLPPPLVSAQRVNSVTSENAGLDIYSDSDIQIINEARANPGADHKQLNLQPSEIVGLQQDDVTSGDPNLENESRCDSQSSLSVSSHPASPQQLSHDELDEYLHVLSSTEEDERNLRSKNDSLTRNQDNDASLLISDSLRIVEDEEWAPDHDQFQHQEEYDEDENIHQEDDEVRDGDDEKTENQSFELTHEEEEMRHIKNNVVLGFDEGVEIEMPNDDFEKILGTREGLVHLHGSSFGFIDENEPVNAFLSEEGSFLPTDNSHTQSDRTSSGMVTENYSLECASEKISTTCSFSCTKHIDCCDSSGVSVFAEQKAVSSSANVTGLGQTRSISSVTPTKVPNGVPVKLQFGLFPGPSIPSQLPAIQIGSIQMPLHAHSPAVPSITPLYPSRPAMFQFGQLHNNSSPSQGILPVAPQMAPFVRPGTLGQISINQSVGVPMTHGEDASTKNVASDFGSSASFANKQGSGSPLHADSKNSLLPEMAREAENQLPHAQPMKQSTSVEGTSAGFRRIRQSSGDRGRRFSYGRRDGHTRLPTYDRNIPAGTNSLQKRPRRVVQRTEYRIRKKDVREPTEALSSSLDYKVNNTEQPIETFRRSGSKKNGISKRTLKQNTETASWPAGSSISQRFNSGDRAVKQIQNVSSRKIQIGVQSAKLNLKNASEEGVDAPLQSGVVRIFKQSGIECLSDEDDFIEVRSKRQMLNDRREQREKEIKAMSLATKPIRKSHASRQKDSASKLQEDLPAQLKGCTVAQISLPEIASEVSKTSTANPDVNSETPSIKPPHLSSGPGVSNDGTDHEHRQIFDSKNKVMSLSQTQIDEAMKPARHYTHVSSVGGHPNAVINTILDVPVPTITEDKTLSSAQSNNNTLAGDKIQFGAVNSPVVLPPSSYVMSHGNGAPDLPQKEAKMSQYLPVSVSGSSLFFKDDPGAGAEEAASVVSGRLRNDLVSANNTKRLGASIISQARTVFSDANGDQQFSSQSRAEELIVSLPADLSVETTPISLWAPLASPQSSSGQMLSQFPSGPHSHIPFYEMNPLLGGPIFALSPNGEPSSSQPHPQKSTPSSSGPHGNWQHHHSRVDSFYRHPAGYSGSFVGPPGIPGVQGAPMVFYNHFTPVGQYGQVGLSFMGAAYIPSGKQADWKNSSSPGTQIAEGDLNSVSMPTMQRKSPSLPPTIQHLAPGSQLLPVQPPLPVFDISHFQAAPDLPVMGHMPSSSLHASATPISRSLQQQAEGAFRSQPNHGHTFEHRVSEPRASMPADTGRSFSAVDDTNVASFPSDLGVVGSLGTTSAPVQGMAAQSSSTSPNVESVKVSRNDNDKQHNPKTQQYAQRNPSHANASGRNFQSTAPRRNQGNEWAQHRVSYHGRNLQSTAGGKGGCPAVKVRQIYVAKPTSNKSGTT